MRGREISIFKVVRLNRTLCYVDWLDQFKDTKVMHLPVVNSDHSPLLIKFGESVINIPRFFKFQAAWVCHPGLEEVVRKKMEELEAYNG